jgi:2-oxoglutarate ferredoxin oxidoreductase subunit gamma
MEEKIIIAGFGGQGILFLGKLISQSGILAGLNTTYIPSYGAEVRGGTAHCHVVLSDSEIASPVIEKPDTLIMMNEPSFVKFEKIINSGGLIISNSSLISAKQKRNDVTEKFISATNIAEGLGNAKVANIVMLGFYSRLKNIISKDIILKNITGPLVELNRKAFNAGYEYEQ